MSVTFIANTNEYQKAGKWHKKHIKTCKWSNISWTFSNANGIGQAVLIKCVQCEEIFDVTDYENW